MLYVKKLVSLNPRKYKFISQDVARARYRKYLEACRTTPYKPDYIKDFDEWLRSEI